MFKNLARILLNKSINFVKKVIKEMRKGIIRAKATQRIV